MRDEPMDEPEEECGVEVVAESKPDTAETLREGFRRAAAEKQERLDMHTRWAKLVRERED